MQDDHYYQQINGLYQETKGSYQVNGETYEVNDNTPPPKNGCGGYGCLLGCGIGCLVFIIIMAVLGILVYFYCIKGVPLQISPETTIISSPLKSDGKSVDFFIAIKEKIEPQGAAENNGFKKVLSAYGKELIVSSPQEDLDYGWIFSEMCKSVGLDPNFAPPHIYKEPNFDEIKIDKKEDKELDDENTNEDQVVEIWDSGYELKELTFYKKILSEKWTIKDYPKLAEWLAEVDSGLDVVQKSAMEEIYSVPMVRRNENELAIMSIPQAIITNAKLVRGLQVRAMLRVGSGEIDKAWNDLFASIQLQHKLTNKGIQVFDNRSDNIKLQIIKTFAESASKCTPEQLNKAIADLESIPQNTNRENLLLTIQYILLDMFSVAGDSKQFVESISGQTIDSPASEQLKNMAGLMELCGFNWNIVAKRLNESATSHKTTINDTDTEKILNTTANNAKQEIDKFAHSLSAKIKHKMSNLFTVTGRSEVTGILVGDAVTEFEKYIFKQILNNEVRYRLLQTAFAIELYKSENKQYPESLDQLKLNPPKISALKTNYKITDKGYKISIGNIELEITPDTQ